MPKINVNGFVQEAGPWQSIWYTGQPNVSARPFLRHSIRTTVTLKESYLRQWGRIEIIPMKNASRF